MYLRAATKALAIDWITEYQRQCPLIYRNLFDIDVPKINFFSAGHSYLASIFTLESVIEH